MTRFPPPAGWNRQLWADPRFWARNLHLVNLLSGSADREVHALLFAHYSVVGARQETEREKMVTQAAEGVKMRHHPIISFYGAT